MPDVIGDGSLDVDEVRHRTLAGMFTNLGDLYYDFFFPLDRLQLSLFMANDAFNVRALHLRASVDNLDYFSRNVRRCLDFGRLSPEAIVETLQFIRGEAPGNTDPDEQGHGSGAVLVKFHERFSENMLRACLANHQAMAGLQRVDPEPMTSTLRSSLGELAHQGDLSAYTEFLKGRFGAVAWAQAGCADRSQRMIAVS